MTSAEQQPSFTYNGHPKYCMCRDCMVAYEADVQAYLRAPPRVLVCGSRHLKREHGDVILTHLQKLPPGWTLIHGDARGADTLAAQAGFHAGAAEIKAYPAQWALLGTKAGPIRNQRMLDEGKPDLVLAFHTDPELGRGTADMVRRARAAGVLVEVIILEKTE